jgi:hypothetical protein
LILGTPYVDIGGKATIRNIHKGEYLELEYHKRGWTGHPCKVTGQIFNENK